MSESSPSWERQGVGRPRFKFGVYFLFCKLEEGQPLLPSGYSFSRKMVPNLSIAMAYLPDTFHHQISFVSASHLILLSLDTQFLWSMETLDRSQNGPALPEVTNVEKGWLDLRKTCKQIHSMMGSRYEIKSSAITNLTTHSRTMKREREREKDPQTS